MLKLFFFDAAGTLFEPREPVGRSYARIARAYGVVASDDQVNAAFRRVFHQAPGLAFGPGRTAAELRVLEYRWWRELVAASFAGLGTFSNFDAYFEELFGFFADPDNWQLDPAAPPLLRHLRDHGFGLGLISNFDYRLYRILEGLGLSSHFDSVTISSEAGYAKPSPEVFRIALAKHRADPAEAIHIGDSEHLDVAGASGAGLAALLLDPAATPPVLIEGRIARIATLNAVLDTARQIPFP